MSKNTYLQAFKGVHFPFFDPKASPKEEKLNKLFSTFKSWYLDYHSYDTISPLSSYQELSKELSGALLKKVALLVEEEYLSSEKIDYSPQRVRQTAMRLIFEILQSSPDAEPLLIDERYPSPLASMLIASLAPLTTHTPSPTIERMLHTSSAYKFCLEELSSQEKLLFYDYGYRPELFRLIFPKKDPLIESKLWQIKSALMLASSVPFQSAYIYGQHNPNWVLGITKTLYKDQSSLPLALTHITNLSSYGLAPTAFHIIKKRFSLPWHFSEICDDIAYQSSLKHRNLPEKLSFLEGFDDIRKASSLLSASQIAAQKYYQCSSCYTLYASPSNERLDKLNCHVCQSFGNLFSSALKKFSSSEEGFKLFKAILKRLKTPTPLEEKSFTEVLEGIMLIQDIHKQPWTAYKKLAYRAHDEVRRLIFLENFVDNLFLFKLKMVVDMEKVKSTHFFQWAPWARSFFSKTPKSPLTWIQEFLHYLTFPYPPSSLFRYKTFGAVDAHIDSNYRGCYLASSEEEYCAKTAKWPPELFKLAKAYQYNPYYEEGAEKLSLTEVGSRLSEWFDKVHPQEAPLSLKEIQKCLDNYQKLSSTEKIDTLNEAQSLCENLIKKMQDPEEISQILHFIVQEKSLQKD